MFKWKISKKLLSKNKVAKEEICTYVLKVKIEQADNRAYSEYFFKRMLIHENEGIYQSRVNSKNKHDGNQRERHSVHAGDTHRLTCPFSPRMSEFCALPSLSVSSSQYHPALKHTLRAQSHHLQAWWGREQKAVVVVAGCVCRGDSSLFLCLLLPLRLYNLRVAYMVPVSTVLSTFMTIYILPTSPTEITQGQ